MAHRAEILLACFLCFLHALLHTNNGLLVIIADFQIQDRYIVMYRKYKGEVCREKDLAGNRHSNGTGIFP